MDKKFNYLGSRWSSIEPETNESMKKEGYVILRRQPSYWIMKKQGGQMVTGIDAKPENLPQRVREHARSIVATY